MEISGKNTCFCWFSGAPFVVSDCAFWCFICALWLDLLVLRLWSLIVLSGASFVLSDWTCWCSVCGLWLYFLVLHLCSLIGLAGVGCLGFYHVCCAKMHWLEKECKAKCISGPVWAANCMARTRCQCDKAFGTVMRCLVAIMVSVSVVLWTHQQQHSASQNVKERATSPTVR